VFLGVYVAQLSISKCTLCLEDHSGIYLAPIRTDCCQNCYPLSATILQGCCHLLLLPKLFRKDAFRSRSLAKEEAFLVHVVHILSVNVVLLHFCVKKIEVCTIAMLSVSLKAIAIDTSSVFQRKLVAVLS
jgi:hypothetical protein